jgi:protein tyrosine phosphatase (PTP) superfamily phosphohydrolase (DUF442 family)
LEVAETIKPIDTPELHNAYRVSERVYSGGGPEGDAAFATLKELGVKTIISVDGAKPDVERARKQGMTYVHLPFGYDGIPRDRVIALAKAAELPGPIYVHCHHGKHRGPAAVAVIQLCSDPSWDVAKAEEWLRVAGTDPKYTGLIELPKTLVRPTPEELAKAPSIFSESAVVPDLARLMVEIDSRWDHLKIVKSTGWKPTKEHPDIDPAHEALQLVELYREAGRMESIRGRGDAFRMILKNAEEAAVQLESALRAKPVDAKSASSAFTRSAAACTACHEQFRDRPRK